MPTLPPRALLRAAMVALASLPACRAAPSNQNPAATGRAPADESVQVAPVIAPAPRFGLEITWWIAGDSDAALSRTLRDLALPDQRIDPAALDRLRLQGLRPVRIAEASLLDLTTALPPTGGIERLWIGLAPDWTPTRFPAPFEPNVIRAIPGLDAPIAAGMLRFLWRAYLAAEDLAPILRTDLTGQAISADYARARMGERTATTGGEARLPRPIDAGPIIEDLTSTLIFHPGEVIILVADNPDADWSAPRRPGSALPDPDDPYGPPPFPRTPPPPVDDRPLLDAEDQPPVPPPPPDAPTDADGAPPSPQGEIQPPPRITFGELVLSPPLPTSPWRPGKLIIALIPQIPERLELIPRPRAPR